MISIRRHLEYANGFLELGMIQHARRELNAIPRNERTLPAVLSMRINLHMQARQWRTVIAVSRQLVRAEPSDDKGWISWAFALRELDRVREAKEILLQALPLHGKTCAVLHYNLACYECLLGNPIEAKRHLITATRKDKQWKDSALDDPDLKALWPEIAKMGA